MHLNLAHVARN